MVLSEAALRWAQVWASAWPVRDVEAIVALQAPDGVHWASMFRPFHGRDGLRAYVEQAFAEETAPTECWFFEPIVGSDIAAVEYWSLGAYEGEPMTISGCTVLRFDAEGLVVEARDYSHMKPGHHPVPDHLPVVRPA
jgi:ketosteroid isomerase-like protein